MLLDSLLRESAACSNLLLMGEGYYRPIEILTCETSLASIFRFMHDYHVASLKAAGAAGG